MSLSPWTWSPLRTLNDTLRARRGNRRRAAGAANRRRLFSEPLEGRLLLTTLRGGDVFEYVDASDEIVRIRLQGNIAAEVVGARVTSNNTAEATNLPGVLNGVDVFGGLGGPGGIDIIGRVGGLTGDPDLNALAANQAGAMYGFEIVEVPVPNPTGGDDTRNLVYLVQITFPPVQPPPTPLPAPYGPRREVGVTAVRLAEISDEIIAESEGVFDDVNTVPAADFNPDNGLLYFVATGGEDNFDKLFTVNVAGGIEASVNGIPGFFNDPGEDGVTVASIAFDQTASGAELVGLFGEDSGGDGGNEAIAVNDFIGVINITNSDDITDIAGLTLFDPDSPGGNTDAPDLAGFEILDDDPTQQDDLLAVGGGNSYQVTRDPVSNFAPGTVVLFGELTEPVPPGFDPPDDPTGSDPSGMMFVPTIFDPFTGTLGAYIAFDQQEESNKLFFVNRLEQLPVTIFQIYVQSSDITGRIVISRVPPLDAPNRDMTPFAGDVGGIRHVNADDPAQFPWPVDTAGQNVGHVFIGARTRDLSPLDPNDDLRPLLTATIPENLNLGLLPAGTLPVDPDTGLRVVGAGMTINGDIDRVLIGGAVTGDVVATGSINQFYCGWLLTGDARGLVAGTPIERPQNFRAGGDIRDLYVLDSIGSHTGAGNAAPTYLTGFDLQAGGNVGHIRTGDSLLGAFQVRNQPEEDPTIGIDVVQTEIELKTNPQFAPAWDQFEFTGNAFFTNDSFDNPEYRGTINSLGQGDIVRAAGTLQHTQPATSPQDWVDYYAVPLLAGQTIQAQLFTALPVINLGVFDPDGRLIASDYSNASLTSGLPFSFTADRPGAYRFAVAATGNPNFSNENLVNLNTSVPYEVRVTNVGDLAVGGVHAAQNILDVPASESIAGERGFFVEFGDMGSFRAGNAMLSITTTAVLVAGGNLREIDGASIGIGTPTALQAGVDVDVPAGSVGLIRARTGILYFNPLAPSLGRSIGGNFQVIDGASTVGVDLVADGGLGVLRGENMATNPASTITLNFDNIGNDGIIDLIDVTGQFGTINSGGPQISTNTGGNVRYIRVGGEAFVDASFGGGFPIRTIGQNGETVSLTDDSGALIRIVPAGRAPAGTPANQPTNPGDLNALIVRSYPIRGSGGVVVMDVTTDDSVNIDTSGSFGGTAEIGTIVIQGARALGPRIVRDPTQRVADFTTLLDYFAPLPSNSSFNANTGFDPINPGSGGGLGEPDYRRAPNPLTSLPRVPAAGTPVPTTPEVLQVVIRGNVKTDVFSIIGVDANNIDGDGQFSLISNDTDGGELVNITAVSVGEIVSNGTIGLAKPSISNVALHAATTATGASVPFPTNEYPFAQAGGSGLIATAPGQRTGVWIYGDLDENHDPNPPVLGDATLLPTVPLPEPGNIISIRARDGLGNIVVNGSIGEVIPNKDNLRGREGIFAGIQGPVWARGNPEFAHVALSDEGGDIYYVNIGEGIAASGSGAFARSGLFAGRRIDTVEGENADIRGDIVAGDAINPIDITLPTPAAERDISIPDSIGRIFLRNGSLINADVIVTTSSLEAREQPFVLTSDEFPEPVRQVFYEIGGVEIRGDGGIIGALFSASDIGPIDVNRGFGVFSSTLVADGDGRVAGIEADNYGIRGVVVNAGASMNFLNARGDGSSVSTAAFSQGVRRSEPQFGALDAFGVDPITGLPPSTSTDIHTVLLSSQAAPEVPGRTDTGIIEDVDVRGQRDLGSVRAHQVRATSPDLLPSRINFGNRVGSVIVRDQINGLTMTTGRLGNFRPQADVFNLDLTVSGPLKDLVIQGDLAEGSVIRTQGRSGTMGNIRILGSLDGDVLSSGSIRRLFVGESIRGNVGSTSRRGNAIGQLIIGGDIAEGGLNVQGNMGRIVLAGDLGPTGSDFRVSGKLGSLTVKGNLYSNVIVGSTLGRLNVGGSIITGSLIEARRINSVTVGGDVQPGVIFRSGRAPRIRTGGQMLGDVQIV